MRWTCRSLTGIIAGFWLFSNESNGIFPFHGMKRETLTCPQNLKICVDTNFKKGGLLLSSNDRAVVISVAGSMESEILDVSAEVSDIRTMQLEQVA